MKTCYNLSHISRHVPVCECVSSLIGLCTLACIIKSGMNTSLIVRFNDWLWPCKKDIMYLDGTLFDTRSLIVDVLCTWPQPVFVDTKYSFYGYVFHVASNIFWDYNLTF